MSSMKLTANIVTVESVVKCSTLLIPSAVWHRRTFILMDECESLKKKEKRKKDESEMR